MVVRGDMGIREVTQLAWGRPGTQNQTCDTQGPALYHCVQLLRAPMGADGRQQEEVVLASWSAK